MPRNNIFRMPSIGQELLNVPMGDMIRQMAFAIADAQLELDKSSIQAAEMMSGHRVERDEDGNPIYRKNGGTGEIVPSSELGSNSDAALSYVDTRVDFGTNSVSTSTAPVTQTATRPTPQAPATTGGVTTEVAVQGDGLVKTVRTATGEAVTLETWTWGASGDAAVYVKTTTTFEQAKVSMMELGFTPTFYQFVDTIIEVKIAIKMAREESFGVKGSLSVKVENTKTERKKSSTFALAASVEASYAAKYNYSAEGSSVLRTKLVPVPPPAVLEERIRLMLAAYKAQQGM